MEDDDEFGDLYTDVLQPFTTSSAPLQPSLHPPSGSVDVKDTIPSDDEEILYGVSNSSKLDFAQPDSNLNLNENDGNSVKVEVASAADRDSGARVLASGSGVVKVEEKGFEEDRDFRDASNEGFLQVKEDLDDNFGIEDTGDEGLEIPGLSGPGVRVSEQAGDDWDDSDSEDDLQIVLNDDDRMRMMGMEGIGGKDDMGGEEGDNLVIIDDPNLHHQAMEELQDWGEDASQAAEGGGGDRKDLLGGDAGKGQGGEVVVAPKVGYSSQGYHPFHSQFKYVRPGAAPMPGASPTATGGTTGQVRPPAAMLPFAGRGRGDWRPTGMKNAPLMQKNFHPGFGMPGWGNNGAGRGFGTGLDFTLPSHKTIFEVDIDGFEEKPWRLPGIDISDFFNFGLNEESWKEYYKQLEQHRLEATMQSRIRVYESGWTEQEYDPDLPPELAAAAGIHNIPSENQNIGKTDVQGDLTKGPAHARMQLPSGRAIQVETGSGERLPSIDTRPPRVRDLDAIIEIVLQESADETVPGNDFAEQAHDDLSKENLKEGLQVEGDIALEDNHFDSVPHPYDDRKRELVGRKAPFMGSVHDEPGVGDGIPPFHSEAQINDHPDSRGKTSAYPRKKLSSPRNNNERWTNRRSPDRSPHLRYSGNLHDEKFVDNQKEESTESVGCKQSPPPLTPGSPEERGFGHNNVMEDEVVIAAKSSRIKREEIALGSTATDTLKDEKVTRTKKKQKLISEAEQSSVEKFDDEEDSRLARSSENSKARSGSSRDQRNMRDNLEEEVVQAGNSMRGGNIRRSLSEEERNVRSRRHDERQESQRHGMTMKGMEDPDSRKKWDPNSGHHSHLKSENLNRRKGRESEGVWQDEDLHVRRTRPEDMTKRHRGEEMVSRHRHKVRENERSDKDEHHSRNVLENGSWKGDHDRDLVYQQKRDDSVKTLHDSSDGIHSKRRKEEVHARRADHSEREETLRTYREHTSYRKREKDDKLDQRKKDEQTRLRDDDQHSFKYKEEGWLQRERVERPRERDEWKEKEGHGEVRSGRGVEDKTWIGNARLKEGYRSTDREYLFKDTSREQHSRRERVVSESLSRHRGREDAYTLGNKLNNDERKSRQERGNTGTDHSVNATDMPSVQEKKHKESRRKSKETDGATHNPSRRNREDHSNQRSERGSSRGMLEQGNGEQNTVNRQSSKKHKEDVSSEDEHHDSRRGRSKFERWTSQKDRDFTLGIKSSSSHNAKETDRYNNGGASNPPEKFPKPEEIIENSNAKPLAEDKDSIPPMKNDEAKPAEDKHLDTVEKLKKRSERFKLPMPSDKEPPAVKKTENEPLPENSSHPDSDIKPERPARKRRWTSG